ncbi:Rieske (2Fe-2S) protein [Aldersonia sp. NBC_00410]|uniref:QcrA and Rieske domain-containing protein n=1 Tax=Aldersonia sp. NBC_00410 TaxID=2975954 RepID=UPI00225857B9|nr:Rieske (2Fe-2S) protein [Aldersonia sp. NBC_00410]MCX5042774.1 Rieske (2Fe-2S) protein [Aldersonia sp. NBC_00410]
MSVEGVRIDRRRAVTGIGVAAAAVAVGGTIARKLPAASAAPAAHAPGTVDCAATATEVAKAADVPVGGGVILGDLVLTQPNPGEFRAFCATCTHLGCHLSTVRDGTVNCRCHGSKFHFDGTVAKGPAFLPLFPRTVRVAGDALMLEPIVEGLDLPCLPSIPPEQFPKF